MDSKLKKLQYVPYGTLEHRKLLNDIQKDYKSKEFIMCMHGRFSPERNIMADKNISSVNPDDILRASAFFPSDEENVFASKDFFFVRRDRAEYNLDYRQVNVGILVIDEDQNVLVLRKKSNNFLTMVGGHTDFNREAYQMSVNELLTHNIRKEFGEELKTDINVDDIPESPLFFTTEGTDMWDFLHSWFIYLLPVKSLRDFSIKSGEKDRHDVVIMPIDDVLRSAKVKVSLCNALKLYKEAANGREQPTFRVERAEDLVGSHQM